MDASEPTAYQPLCLCGVRGCALADQHRNAFVQPARRKGGRILFGRPRRRRH